MQSLEHKITQHVQNQIDSNVDTGPAEVALAGGVFLFGLDTFGGKKQAEHQTAGLHNGQDFQKQFDITQPARNLP